LRVRGAEDYRGVRPAAGSSRDQSVTNREPVLTFLPVGRCIYCRREKKLSDEHIVPLSLGGAWILPKASCGHCCNETHAFEGKVAGGMLKAFRTRYGLPSRKGHPKTLPIHFAPDGGTIQTEHVAPAEHPAPVVLLKMRRAGILLGVPAGIQRSALFKPEVWTYSPDIQKRTLAKGWGVIKNAARYDGLAFCRTLAKIGHAWAVAHHGLDSFTPLALDLILGRTTDVEFIVGGAIEERTPRTDTLHELSSGLVVNNQGAFSS
jgi:HNH endonuclease